MLKQVYKQPYMQGMLVVDIKCLSLEQRIYSWTKFGRSERGPMIAVLIGSSCVVRQRGERGALQKLDATSLTVTRCESQ